ncbi:MFS transporter [Paenibacillus sp. GP183]|jgi:hypothetical protein|uniref:MFS transporter n=1 Tax=Paenibacillus sp. GP183 TaxID=1882751 RepID=UPI000894783B|nr:MFS transporter [Paenibacillus sp. GP183]SEC60311.1 hypothetical protein SAMN05443246_4667 [Paenibacillus sp. GP183]
MTEDHFPKVNCGIRITDDWLMIALVIFAQLMPSAFLSVFISPLTDRFPKQLSMIFADLTRVVLILSMIFFVHSRGCCCSSCCSMALPKRSLNQRASLRYVELSGTIASRRYRLVPIRKQQVEKTPAISEPMDQ